MKYKFNDIFTLNKGQLTPKLPVKIKGIQLGPGVSLGKGVTVEGINLFDYQKAMIEARQDKGVLILKGFYVKDGDGR